MIGKLTNKILSRFGYELVKANAAHADIYNDKPFMDLYKLCKPFTMTSIERMYTLYKSLIYIIENNIEGDFVECGVWKGGSSMLIAKFLAQENILDRQLYMYDTFEGMVEPTKEDVDVTGQTASKTYLNLKTDADTSSWCYSSIDEVKGNMSKTNFPNDLIVYVKGKIEDTIPNQMPNKKIALLRLDTDWYSSTKHELDYLYPLLNTKGVLIIDDFGHWDGAKKAVIEYFEKNKILMLLNRIDYTGRIGLKL